MAKYDITYSCGHSGTIDLIGKGSEREKKIKYYEKSGLCPACYEKQKVELKSKEPFVLELRIQPFCCKPFQLVVVSGNTKAYKDVIKSLGFKWLEADNEEVVTLENLICKSYAWCINLKEEEIKETIKSICSTLPKVEKKIKKGYTNRDLTAYNLSKEMLKNVVYPEKPSCFPKGYWNGVFYKTSEEGMRRIYVDKQETLIPENEASLIEKYQKDYRDYKSQIAKIKETVLNEI